ncbi:MAG: DUF1080 domain-containing protein [Opitutales bacterium]
MRLFLLPVIVVLLSCVGCKESAQNEWVPIFNGKDLSGWTIKICGYPLGENYKNTFVVEDGMMRVDYSEYEKFDVEYAHIYYNEKLSHYRLRLEYRFYGERVSGSKGFTELNSGVMFHSQSAASVGLEQQFPVSVEAQFLAEGKGDYSGRTTMNIATPGTSVVLEDGTLQRKHMTWSDVKARLPGEWVQVEIEVQGSELVIHRIDGVEVLRYRDPQIDNYHLLPEDYPLASGTILKDGYIALQGESHPVDFRNIELMILPGNMSE